MKAYYFALLSSISLSGFAGEKNSAIIVEVDPLPYCMGGYGGHLGWSPEKAGAWTFGLGFVASASYPKVFVNMDEENKDQGWNVQINQGFGVSSHYNFGDETNSWFVGLQFFTQEMRLSNDNFPGIQNRTNTILLAAQFGYQWFPFDDIGFYIRPWAGLGYQQTIKGTFEPDEVTTSLKIGDKAYYLAPIMPFATVHLGYKF